MLKLSIKITRKQRELVPLLDERAIRFNALTGTQRAEYDKLWDQVYMEGD